MKGVVGSETEISDSINRGRAALADAEEHIRMFEQYLNGSKLDRNKQEPSINSENIKPNSNIVLLDQTTKVNQGLLKDKSYCYKQHEKTELIDQLIRNGEERYESDQVIASARREGDVKLRYGGELMKYINCYSSSNTKSKETGKTAFDPSNLSAAKRARVKFERLAEEKAKAEVETLKKTQFKALPLPGKAYIKNDPYALTKAALAKVFETNNPNFDASGQSGKLIASLKSNDQTLKAKVIDGKACRSPKKRAREIYMALTNLIEKDSKQSDHVHEEENDLDFQEDLVCLHQDISKLQALLKMKRTHCIKAIDAFADDYQSSDEGGGQGNSCFENSNEISLFTELMLKNSNSTPDTPSTNKESESRFSKKSMYSRSKDWLEMIKGKNIIASKKKEEALLQDVTGSPNFKSDKKNSWDKAKIQHDELVAKQYLKERLFKLKKEEKDRLCRKRQAEEADKYLEVVNKKKKELKAGINKKDQISSVENLSQPRLRVGEKSKGSIEQCEMKIEKLPDTVEPERMVSKKSSGEKSMVFADMNDKDFARMIKKLGLKGGKNVLAMVQNAETTGGEKKNNRDEESEEPPDKSNKETQNQESIVCENSIEKDLIKMECLEQSENGEQHSETLFDAYTTSEVFQPYQRYEAGEVNFFDRSSSTERGRFRVRDARQYAPDSLRRIPVPDLMTEGVSLLVGKSGIDYDEERVEKEIVITVLFDRSKFSEITASDWWSMNRKLFV
jgi:hypothetical protein